MKTREASGPILWYMRLCGFAGWASFWSTIYLVPERMFDQRLIRHELCHLEQIRRDGRLKFTVQYLYWLLRHGYQQNPYEVEARRAELS